MKQIKQTNNKWTGERASEPTNECMNEVEKEKQKF